jgi:hypothetical protein
VRNARGDNGAHDYVRTETGLLRMNPPAERSSALSAFSLDGRYQIVAMMQASTSRFTTDQVDMQIQMPVTSDTLPIFQQRYRTVTSGAQLRAGVSERALEEAWSRLGLAHDFPLGVGMAVTNNDNRLIGRLPTDTMVALGDPSRESVDSFGVWRKSANGRFTRILGGTAFEDARGRIKVVALPGNPPQPDWLTQPWTRESPAQVQAWLKQAWSVGMDIKSEQGWCGEYERAVALAGITRAAADAPVVMTTNAEEVAAMPVGTILRAVHGRDSVMVIRHDDSTNPCRTYRICGTVPGAWARSGLAVVGNPASPVRIQVASREELRQVPRGTRISEHGSAMFWERRPSPGNAEQRDWFERGRMGGYAYRPNDFTVSSMQYTRIGGES